MQEDIAHPRPLPGGGFAQHQYSYHSRDFVYVKKREPHSVYKIGQILKVKAMESPIAVTIQLFGRYDDVVRRALGKNSERQACCDNVCVNQLSLW